MVKYRPGGGVNLTAASERETEGPNESSGVYQFHTSLEDRSRTGNTIYDIHT